VVKRWRVSLATKALGLQLAALLTIAVVVGGTRYYAIRTELYRQVDAVAQTVIQELEEIVTERPELLRPGALDPVIDRFTYRLPSVARVSLVDPGFRILADSRLTVGAAADQTALLPLLREVGSQRFYYDSGGQRYLRVSRSLRGRYDPSRRSDIVGAVSLDMRLALVDAAIQRELISEMGLVLLLMVPIGAALHTILRRRFVRPLEQLADAGARFARGEIPSPLAFREGDELATVARTFNDMVTARARALAQAEELLTASVAEVKVLRGILPICASCKRIKNETGGWEAVESFVRERTDAEFSHGLCPDCAVRDWGAAPSAHST
jgi:HAMP domain-containing protein